MKQVQGHISVVECCRCEGGKHEAPVVDLVQVHALLLRLLYGNRDAHHDTRSCIIRFQKGYYYHHYDNYHHYNNCYYGGAGGAHRDPRGRPPGP